jgi:hypothetical protein
VTVPTHLYRHFDADGRLLYVGISKSALKRLSQHKGRDWFTSISTVKIEAFPTREGAETAEKLAIQTENPGLEHSQTAKAKTKAERSHSSAERER